MQGELHPSTLRSGNCVGKLNEDDDAMLSHIKYVVSKIEITRPQKYLWNPIASSTLINVRVYCRTSSCEGKLLSTEVAPRIYYKPNKGSLERS
jgi:hypothetical protein